MEDYEYRILHMPTTSISVLNERLNSDVGEGWEPIMFSGDEFVNVLMRRPRKGEDRQQ